MRARTAKAFGAVVSSAIFVFAGFGAPAAATPAWVNLIGAWRPADYDSCGIDDLRHGRIVSISRAAIRVGPMNCLIIDGAATEAGLTLDGDCDLGGERAKLAFDWRTPSVQEAIMTHQGFETQLIRCEGGVE